MEEQWDSSSSHVVTVDATSSTSSSASRRARRRVSAGTPTPDKASCSSEAAPALSFAFQQPLTVAFASTNQVFPSSNPTSPAKLLCKSDSALLLRTPKLEPVDESNQLKSADNDFNELETECLLIHNNYREKHDVPPLALNKQMCEFAKSMATALCAYTRLPPLPERKYGQIILVSKSTEPVSIYDACRKWYEQSYNYEFGVEPKASKSRKNNKCNFTQMIWRGTRELGVGRTYMNGTTAIVALYHPAGNVAGQFAYNCPRPNERCPLERQPEFE